MVLFDEQQKLSLMEPKIAFCFEHLYSVETNKQTKNPLYIQGRFPNLLSVTVADSMTPRSLGEERIYLIYKSIIEKS